MFKNIYISVVFIIYIRNKYHNLFDKDLFSFLLKFFESKIFFFRHFSLKKYRKCWIYWKGCVCCSKGSRILNVNALFSVIALVYKEKLFPFFILWRCLFSILNFRYFFLPSNDVHFNIYSVSISFYTFANIDG